MTGLGPVFFNQGSTRRQTSPAHMAGAQEAPSWIKVQTLGGPGRKMATVLDGKVLKSQNMSRLKLSKTIQFLVRVFFFFFYVSSPW